MQKIVNVFCRLFSQDGNGYINRLELRHVLLNLGEEMTEEDCDALVEEADTDGDGSIDYDEFYSMMTSAGRRVVSGCRIFVNTMLCRYCKADQSFVGE